MGRIANRASVAQLESMPPAPAPTLRQWLALQGGAAPFRRFMEAALYDPAFGYYTTRIRTVGARGDFATSASLSPLLARGIAAWISSAAPPDCQNLIEIGPGSGELHRALRQALGWRGRRRWRSHLVERSPVLREEQRRNFGWQGRRVQWHENPADALVATGGQAMIFSNELVDAFPVSLIQLHAGTWQEVWLELTSDDGIVETVRPAESNCTGLDPANFAEGQRIECHQSFRDWSRIWHPHWRGGAMLTIDYGGTADRLYYRRPGGTVRGYFQHRRLGGLAIYRDPGHCDLTADVNFSDLMRWGTEAGVETVSLESQAAFLFRYARARSPVEATLMDADGAGGAFQCLVQRPLAKITLPSPAN